MGLFEHDSSHVDMKKEKIEVFSHATNQAVVRMPDRRFPGVVIQGDSLSILFDDAMRLVEALAESKDEESFLTALMMAERLESHLRHYEEVLKRNGMELPYRRDPAVSTEKYKDRFSKNDFPESKDV